MKSREKSHGLQKVDRKVCKSVRRERQKIMFKSNDQAPTFHIIKCQDTLNIPDSKMADNESDTRSESNSELGSSAHNFYEHYLS